MGQGGKRHKKTACCNHGPGLQDQTGIFSSPMSGDGSFDGGSCRPAAPRGTGWRAESGEPGPAHRGEPEKRGPWEEEVGMLLSLSLCQARGVGIEGERGRGEGGGADGSCDGCNV